MTCSRVIAWGRGLGWRTLAVLALLGSGTAAAVATAPEPRLGAARHLASGHGVGHDPAAVYSIARWMALGQPTGRPSVPAALAAPGAQHPAEGVERVVTITTKDSNLAFEPATLSLKAGTRVRLDYVNDGVLPHNFVLLQDEDDLDALGAAAYEAEATGYVPVEGRDKLLAFTALAAPGTTVSVTFVVPAPGTYTFVCLFPGHYNVMLGSLRALN